MTLLPQIVVGEIASGDEARASDAEITGQRVEDITSRASLVRELALITVTAGHTTRSSLMQVAQARDAKVVDVRPIHWCWR